MPITTERAAVAEIKRIALMVREAAEELHRCAERMKHKGDGVGANAAYKACLRFRAEAHVLLGGEV